MSSKYPWYEVVDGKSELMQGDFIEGCPVVRLGKPNEKGEYDSSTITTYDAIILSQSCDLIEKKIELVLVCPYWSLGEVAEKQPLLKSNKGKDKLRKGEVIGLHLLKPCELTGFKTDFLVVDFRAVFSVSYESIVELVQKSKQRLRLSPPYREHLAHAFGRFVTRVGLPEDIPPFET